MSLERLESTLSNDMKIVNINLVVFKCERGEDTQFFFSKKKLDPFISEPAIRGYLLQVEGLIYHIRGLLNNLRGLLFHLGGYPDN